LNEISAILNIPEGTVKSRLNKALNLLRLEAANEHIGLMAGFISVYFKERKYTLTELEGLSIALKNTIKFKEPLKTLFRGSHR